ncbi:30S ribosomal protein S19 [Candidatus Berkelbacteria bacterium CG_4_9_14_3_um_filter_39_23]|uniref:Small ribosomal subunit protein uS19 n=2 Tax=Candidatus Berkelbacteria TaxID=1618330 RepID=A0A2M7CJ66_9BACT|nr:30S ribosomal protein S19 [Candidatus Berkelbacteria bacterium]OIP06187.1 MAG: 30S ribosomal protein S19 [Candidatus Berkelbacteria bacterium CG2_30_39_44]PIR28089.1 MAG: 30S ribosomal protein S19 [Candidatus Berkelbacteria bacterium CG11_big_fil_rev_8_21_14_0_20_40_23]PIV25665.1 MAG: 30S ribosomal protein S19 [Candidatus Berkelbacteria bacterium CG03_land_8_20_14_0_80_40_36]PIX30729.1 MAG: 30S ribosomal protein S19 [Candidatus Berkelbacteria bacterium CG_4_8_14_3_um_filter_39_27]PIZ28885.1
MSRSIKKGPYVPDHLMKKIQVGDPKKTIRTWARASQIIPAMVGRSFEVHNGRKFIMVNVNEEMVGHRLGEFSPTRTFHRHGGKMAKQEEQAVQAKEFAKNNQAKK